jgi:tRNA pseudouridine55 synthase
MVIFEEGLSLEEYREGVLILINKPKGWSSFDVVKKVRYLLQRNLKAKKLKVGHGGTLDPLADGLMLIGVGKATKQLFTIQEEDKEYVARITLGATTPSYDLETEVENKKDVSALSKETIQAAVNSLLSMKEQVPPLFSAKRINGTRAYELARKGEDKTLESIKITIHEAELLRPDLPEIEVRIKCSKGTYIRTIANDLGKIINCGAYLSGLTRTKSGHYELVNAIELDKFEEKIILHKV